MTDLFIHLFDYFRGRHELPAEDGSGESGLPAVWLPH
jgi:hypothetical protein